MDLELLKELVNVESVSGNEVGVRKIILREIKPLFDDVFIDSTGNIIAHKKGVKPSIMFAAHMDEVGLMVKSIKNDGKVIFSIIGGIETLALLGQRVKVNDLIGVISSKELTDNLEFEELPDLNDLFIDFGLNKKELKNKIKPGDFGSFFDCNLHFLGESRHVIAGKALDDRLGCFALVELSKKIKKSKNELFFVFTVQEEIGLYGAKTSVYKISPNYAVVVDVTDVDELHKSKILGKGPCITVKDARMLGNKCLNAYVEKLAKKLKIKIQKDVSDSGTTDALSISLAKGGIPSSVLGICIKNIHSSISIANLNDLKQLMRILEELIKKPLVKCEV